MRRFLIPVFLLSVISWGVFAYVVLMVPPKIGGEPITVNFAYFFVSGWLGAATIFTLIFYFINFLFEEAPKKQLQLEKDLRPRRVFRTSLRRGAIFATTLLSLGVLKVNDLDNLLNSIFVVFIALLIEVYFSSR
jgi:ABC-type multidrug transport system permease subunit